MRYSELLDESVMKMHDGQMVYQRPSLTLLRSLIEKAPHDRTIRGMAYTTPTEDWTIVFWTTDETHQRFYNKALKSGIEIKDDIGIYVATSERDIHMAAASGLIGIIEHDGLFIGYYPDSARALAVLQGRWPKLFGARELAVAESSEPIQRVPWH